MKRVLIYNNHSYTAEVTRYLRDRFRDVHGISYMSVHTYARDVGGRADDAGHMGWLYRVAIHNQLANDGIQVVSDCVTNPLDIAALLGDKGVRTVSPDAKFKFAVDMNVLLVSYGFGDGVELWVDEISAWLKK